ncbi:membrane protein [Streptomyces platensis subsp. clarensis]|nr:membrane protein [Streptomyces platensis subsp. clarensis]
MSDHQPQHRPSYEPHDPYAPQDPYAQPDPYAQQGAYGRPDPYAQQAPPSAAQAPYDPQAPYRPQQAYDPYRQQQAPGPVQQPAPGPYGRGRHAQDQYGYDAYGQQPQHGQPPQHARQPQQPQQPQDGYRAPHAEPAPLPTQHQTASPAEEPYARRHPQQAQPPQHPQQARPAPAAPAPAAVVSSAPLAANQRARAEGRSPIIPPGIQPAALTAGLALLLALTAPLGRPVLAVPVALLQAVTAAGWFRLNGMWPARQGIALAFLAGLTTDVALLATDRESAPLVGIGTLGVWCLLVLVLQLRNRSSADERMYALTAGLTSTALAVLAAGQLAASPHAVVVGAAAVAVAALARALPLPPAASVGISLVAAAGAGIAVGQLTGLGASGALLGLAAGGCALIGLRVASYDYPSRFVHLTAGVALPLALAAPAVYVLGRALG